MRNKSLLTFLAIGLLFCCAAGADEGRVDEAGLLRVIVDPDKYHRRMVRLTGFMHLRPGEDALYLHESDYRHLIWAHSIALEITDDMRNRQRQFTDRYVVIEGFFDADDKDDSNLRNGTLKRIQFYEVWSTPENPINPPETQRAG